MFLLYISPISLLFQLNKKREGRKKEDRIVEGKEFIEFIEQVFAKNQSRTLVTIQRIFSLPVQIFTKEAVVLVFFRTCHDVVVAIAANHGQRFNSTGQETTIMNILVYCIMHRWRVIRHPALLLRLRGVYTLRFARVDAYLARIVASSIETDLWKLNTFDPSPHNFSSISFPKSSFICKR